MNEPLWKSYERMAAAFVADTVIDVSLTVMPNAIIRGRLSQTNRQIDLLIDARWDDNTANRIVVDAKKYRAPVNIKDVESFLGMLNDCGAPHGILVSPKGWTKGAERRARSTINVHLLDEHELEDSNWQASYGRCRGPCVGSSHPGLVLWDKPLVVADGDCGLVVSTGKCDKCRSFHVWCQGCGEKFSVLDDEETGCSCDYLWLALGEDDEDGRLRAIHLVLQVDDNVCPLDRKLLRF